MKAKPWVTRLWIVLAVLALVPVAARADVFADITPGTAAPPPTLGGYTMTPFPADPQPSGIGAFVTSVSSPLGGSVLLSPAAGSPLLEHRTVPLSWPTWSHAYASDVYFAGPGPFGGASVTLSLPAGTGAFYLYAEPFGGGAVAPLFPMVVTGKDAGGLTVAVSQTVDAASGAKYFGFYTTDPMGGSSITSITISIPGISGGFAVGEFGIAKQKSNLVPEPSSLALLALGTLGLAAWRRNKV